MIQSLVVDDEPLAREGLAEYIADIDFLSLVGMCENPIEASKFMQNQTVDLLFLDIQMPKLNGIDFLKSLQKPPMVILTTAYPNYALEGFQLDVLDYLLKPITFQRFFKAAQKAHDYFNLLQNATQTDASAAAEEYFFIKCENKFEKICFADIFFIEGMQNYVHIHTTEGKFLTLLTLKSMEEKLNPSAFLRVHKSYIVAVNHVKGMEGNELFVSTHRIPVSRHYKDSVVERIINGNLWKR